MVKKQAIEFVEAKIPVGDAVTKFGGRPVWLNDPQWPLSATTGNPMQFICQIALDRGLFGPIGPRMACLFMTDEGDAGVDGLAETWEPDGGENAVILQPGNTSLAVAALGDGPTLYRMVNRMFRRRLVPQPCEYTIKAIACEDPDFAAQIERTDWSESQWEKYAAALEGNKIGGTPGFLQGDEFPGPGCWKLLLQLDSVQVPFFVNFGDAGIGYAFIAEDGATAKFLWQCA